MRRNWVKKASVLGIIMLFFGASAVSGLNITSPDYPQPLTRGWLYVGGSGPGNYTKIQDALDNASEGDTIYVYNNSSPYNESLIIPRNKLTLIGEDNKYPIINGIANNQTILISLINNITIRGFKITTLLNNTDYVGINIDKSFYTTIENNLIYKNEIGIRSIDSSDLNISENKIFENRFYGIVIYNCNRIVILKNRIDYNGFCGIGVFALKYSLDSIFDYNVIKHNKITHNYHLGVYLVSCFYFLIENNKISNNTCGIRLDQTISIRILWNNITDNIKSIEQYYSLINLVINNNLISLDTFQLSSTLSVSPYFMMNYWGWGGFLSPRRQCVPIFAPLIFFPWRENPVPINQTWPD